MTSYTLLSSYDTVQVISTTLAVESVYCTIQTHPSGSIVQYAVPKTIFETGAGVGLLNDLAVAVEGMISGGLAVAASGSQVVGAAGLLEDVVIFTVQYVPPSPPPEPLTTTVAINVGILTLDPGIAAALPGGNATEQLQAAYDRLKALAGG